MNQNKTDSKEGRLQVFLTKEGKWNLKLEAYKAQMTPSAFIEKLLNDYIKNNQS